jgi:hypothetical protein
VFLDHRLNILQPILNPRRRIGDVIGLGTDTKGVGDVLEEFLNDRRTITTHKRSRMIQSLVLFYNRSEAAQGINPVISFTGKGLFQIHISQAAMKNMIRALQRCSRNWKEGRIAFLKEGQRIHRANGLRIKPVTGNDDLLLF